MALYAFNGTWNKDDPDESGPVGKDSNVVKFREAYTAKVYYTDGVGTRLGTFGKILGGLTGAGGRTRIRKALEALNENFNNGDRVVDVVGFSRGAALALDFVNEVDRYFNHAAVRFLGLFDTVASFGKPGNEVNLGWKLTLPDNVRKCFHAMALDERRNNFPVTRIKGPRGENPPGERLQEVWFRGVHGDIGGGENLGLTSIAIAWMLENALACGLPIDPQTLQAHKQLWNPNAVIGENLDLQKDDFRRVFPSDKVHASVRFRPPQGKLAFHNPPQLKPTDV